LNHLRLVLPRLVLLVLPSSNRFVRLIPQQAAARAIVGGEYILSALAAAFEVAAVIFALSSAGTGR
jgi:hypothetical protein